MSNTFSVTTMMQNEMRRAGSDMVHAQTPEGKAKVKRDADIRSIAEVTGNIHVGYDMYRHFKIVLDGLLDLQEKSDGRFRFRLFDQKQTLKKRGELHTVRDNVFVVTNLYRMTKYNQKEYLCFVMTRINDKAVVPHFDREAYWRWGGDNMGLGASESDIDIQYSALRNIAYHACGQRLVREENLDGEKPARMTWRQSLKNWQNNMSWASARPTLLPR